MQYLSVLAAAALAQPAPPLAFDHRLGPFQPIGRAMTEVAECREGPRGTVQVTLQQTENRPNQVGAVSVRRIATPSGEINSDGLARINAVVSKIYNYAMVRVSCSIAGPIIEVSGWQPNALERREVQIRLSEDGASVVTISDLK